MEHEGRSMLDSNLVIAAALALRVPGRDRLRLKAYGLPDLVYSEACCVFFPTLNQNVCVVCGVVGAASLLPKTAGRQAVGGQSSQVG
jgi:hypothetical protein